MYEDISEKAKKICDKKIKESYKNWDIQEFSPIHTYTYMYIAMVNSLLKEEYKKSLFY